MDWMLTITMTMVVVVVGANKV